MDTHRGLKSRFGDPINRCLMRITEPKPIARVGTIAETRVRASDAAADVEVDHADQVSTEASDQVKIAAAAVRRELSGSRQVRLAAIEAAVRNGSYKPDPRLIAERILQSAVLDAQIAVSLGRNR